MKTIATALLPVMLICIGGCGSLPKRDVPFAADRYDVVWDTPSEDHSGSMPLGNGDIGLNAWVEGNGDLVFYISKTDSWGDNGRLLKVGKVRVKLSPSPLGSSSAFKQALRLVDGMMNVQYGTDDSATVLRLWVDANRAVIYVEVDGKRKVEATASIELWRTEKYALPSLECSDVLEPSSFTTEVYGPTVVEPDTVMTKLTGRIGWYHHNIKSVGPEICAKIQGIEDFTRPDPLLHRTFGALVTAKNGKRLDDLHLLSSSSTSHRFTICVLTEHPATPQQWLKTADKTIAAAEDISLDERREAHKRWWREFWERSWIHVTSTEAKQDDAFVVSRAYALQRYINACAGRGRYPIKFNGSIFTVAHPEKPGDADYRRWGPGYWWMNTRLPYWPMLGSGDFDLMKPLFRMYGKDLMPLFKYRTRRHVDHDGAYIPECIYFWGDIFSETYGWTPFEERTDKLQASRYHKWEWVSGLELVFMMLDYYEHTLDKAFLGDMALPTAHEILTFFDQQYKTDETGKMFMHPAQALESWWECTNPTPEISGLHAVVDRLLSLPERLTTAKQRTFWTTLKKKLPDLPMKDVEGKKIIAPAEKYANRHSSQNAEMYPVFPFRLYGVGKPNLELARHTYGHRTYKTGGRGHDQDDFQAACLGLTSEARRLTVMRFGPRRQEGRFPGFWRSNYDWPPDQCHGGVGMTALQTMLMQAVAPSLEELRRGERGKIVLLPAWPKEWDVDFKLHAPYKTVVEGSVKDGELVELNVTPKDRMKDIVVMEQKEALAPATEYHVSVRGRDTNNGSVPKPFKTISAAGQVAQPGDVITVHEGVYRERVNPPRGGTSDDKRIVYRAAEGEKVVITGSEVVSGWKEIQNGVWKVTLPNSFFGDYNPYKDVIAGDWFRRQGRDHHTGEVYLNGKALFEEVSIDKVQKHKLSWCCRVDDRETHIHANFADSNPNRELTEINVRSTCFYPDKPGRNYITVKGFTMRHAATQWAPPTAEQVALIGTHWSKGWIIENNVISDSKCVGVTLGKYGDEFDNTSANSAEGYVKTIERALARGWSKATVGSHLIRNNTIYNCGAAGICGSMGGAFSQVTGNHIYNININKPFRGSEQAGIKLHAPIDTLISNNYIHHTIRGIWMDWMTQGTRISTNLCHSNDREDLYVEVNHGPYMVDNNIFLSKTAVKDHSQGGAFSHNLLAGNIVRLPQGRQTPYHKEHSTEIAGLSSISGGDNRFYNNIIVGGEGLQIYDDAKLPMQVDGNVYLNGAVPYQGETNFVELPRFNPNIKVVEEEGPVYLHFTLPQAIAGQQNQLVTTKLLGRAAITGAPYKNYDGSSLAINSDYLGKLRYAQDPYAGPFKNRGTGKLRLKVWRQGKRQIKFWGR